MASPSEACVIQEPDRHGVCKPARGSFHLEAALPLSTVPSISPRISGLQTAPVGRATKVATSTMVQQTVGSCYTPTPTSMTDSLGAVQTAKSHSYQPIPSGGGPSAWTSRRSVSFSTGLGSNCASTGHKELQPCAACEASKLC